MKYLHANGGVLGKQIRFMDIDGKSTYTNGDNNFSAQIARLQALGKTPDVILVSSYSLMGPNGSGKITLINAITGQVKLAGGRIVMGEVFP